MTNSAPNPGGMTVSQLAKQVGVEPHVVRYYSREGLLTPQRNPDNGYMVFDDADIHRLHFIRLAKRLGYTLTEIVEILQDAEAGESPCPKVRDILTRRIEETRQKVEELNALQVRMENALKQWEQMPDGVPDGHTVCHLIESYNKN
jgi:MerR family Zn(II)-responsive transcriptional regulator of zntA